MKKLLIGIIVIVILVAAVAAYKHRPHYDTSAIPSRSLITTASYACDKGKTIAAAYYEGPAAPEPTPGEPPTPTGTVDVSIGGAATTTLNQTISADGARYANQDESLVFWSKGNTALVMRNNTMDLDYTNCVAAR